MKSVTKNIISIALLLLLSVTFHACKDKTGCTDPNALNYDPDAKKNSGDCRYADPQPESPATGNLRFHLHQTFGHNDIDTSAVYTLSNGQKFTLSQIRYYISNVSLVKDDGSEALIPDSYLLARPSEQNYVLEKAKPGIYTKLKFYLGIDSATNSGGMMPTDRPSGHPLGIQTPSMFWTWASGYIFMRLEGIADTLGGGGLNASLAYHIGTNDLRRIVEIPVPTTFEITAGNETTLHLKADFRELFKHLDFKTERMTHTMGNMSLAVKVADKSALMFGLAH